MPLVGNYGTNFWDKFNLSHVLFFCHYFLYKGRYGQENCKIVDGRESKDDSECENGEKKYRVFIKGSNLPISTMGISAKLRHQEGFSGVFPYCGLPELAIIDNQFKREWLGNLYNKIYFGDLITRYGIRNPLAMKTLIRKLSESVKQPQSYNRLANLVSSVAGKVKQETVVDYLGYIKDTV